MADAQQDDVAVAVSIGIATYPVDGSDAETLIKNADAAMYKAKEEGRNCIQFYSNSINDGAIARFNLENDLRRYAGTLVFVTHDRAFLQRLSTRIVELDRDLE